MRSAGRDDAAAVHAVTQAAYAPYDGWLDPPPVAGTETEQQVAEELAAEPGLLAEVEGEVVAALRLRTGDHASGPDLLWVRRVSVVPPHRRRGLALLLLAAAEDEAVRRGQRLRLGVRLALEGNQALYARAGWVPLRDREGFWLEMARPLPMLPRTPAEMRDLGARLARDVLRPGDLVLLDGPLGAGKTVLAQGIAAGLGIPVGVRSPTYTVVDEHRGSDPRTGGPLRLLHLDAWRLSGPAELDDLDLATDDAVTVVEWGVGRAEQLAADHLTVRVQRRDNDVRTVRLEPAGGDWPTRLAAAGLL